MSKIEFRRIRDELPCYLHCSCDYPLNRSGNVDPDSRPEPWIPRTSIGGLGYVVWYDVQVAIYLGFIWSIIRELTGFVLPIEAGNYILPYCGLEFQPVKWQYEVDDAMWSDATRSRLRTPMDVQLVGYRLPDTQMVDRNYWPNSSPGYPVGLSQIPLIRVHAFADLYSCCPPVLLGPASRMNFYGVESGRDGDLFDFLNSADKPNLSTFLRSGEIMGSLTIRNDEEEHSFNSLLICSRDDLSSTLQRRSEWFVAACESFEARAESMISWDSYRDELEVLALGFLDTKEI